MYQPTHVPEQVSALAPKLAWRLRQYGIQLPTVTRDVQDDFNEIARLAMTNNTADWQYLYQLAYVALVHAEHDHAQAIADQQQLAQQAMAQAMAQQLLAQQLAQQAIAQAAQQARRPNLIARFFRSIFRIR